jgi:hypothetical protein
MPIALPAPRDRKFDDLVAEARRRLPRLAPTWTDHNLHDPGITLIELLAWVTESDVYRAGRISEATRRAFLRWFGIELAGPGVAETVLQLDAEQALTVPADTPLESADGSIVFTTAEALVVQPSRLESLLVPNHDAAGLRISCAELQAPVLVFGAQPTPNRCLGLEFADAISGTLELYFWTGTPDHDTSAWNAVRKGAAFTGDVAPPESLAYPGVSLAWEARAADDSWRGLRVLRDETRSLTLSGFVRLELLEPAQRLRVRLVSGTYDAPPSIRTVLPNAVRARHLSPPWDYSVPEASNARAGQGVRVPGAPLSAEHTQIGVSPGVGPALRWTPLRFWDTAGPHDRVARVDHERGQIDFGDGRQGAVPAAGETIVISSRTGGGAAGNVVPGTLCVVRLAGANPTVQQPFPARGGAGPQSLDDGRAALLERLARPSRAVTPADIERLTFETPGVRVGRVRIVPGLHPRFPEFPASDSVTVVVIPEARGSRPTPSPGMLQAVTRQLESRRPLCTEVHVIGPSYVTVAVRARLLVLPNTDPDDLLTRAEQALDAYFHPLTGGPTGSGWPVGRDVHRSEIYALLQGLSGVHHAADLEFLFGDPRLVTCGNVPVRADGLIAAGRHELDIQDWSPA